MIPRLVRLVLAGIVASAAAGSAQAFGPVASSALNKQSQAAYAPVTRVHDSWHNGHAMRGAPPVVVVRPRHQVRDGLCVTRQPVTSISCYRYLREQQFHQHFAHHNHEHGSGCGHTPRWAQRHNQIVFLGWF